MSEDGAEIIDLWGLPVRTTRHPDFRSSRLYVGPDESKSVLTHLKEIGRKMAAAEFGPASVPNQVVNCRSGAETDGAANGSSAAPSGYVRTGWPLFEDGLG